MRVRGTLFLAFGAGAVCESVGDIQLAGESRTVSLYSGVRLPLLQEIH